MIILLDLNFTLVENSDVKLKPFVRQIENETYSFDLINRIKTYTVILMTARPDMHRETTLKNIAKKTNWLPQAAFFNEWFFHPPACKKRILEQYVFPKFGKDPAMYVAVESNPQTRSMYEKLGIVAITKETVLENFELKA